MLRERNQLILQAHKVLDICLTAAAFVAAYYIKRDFLPEPFRGLLIAPNYYLILLMIIIIWYVVFSLVDLYESYRRRPFIQIFFNMAKGVSIGMLLLILCMYIFKITDVSRIMMGIFFLLNIGLLGLSKGVVYAVLTQYRTKGFNFRNILIIGSRERAREIIDVIEDHLGAGFRVLGCLDTDPNAVGKSVKGNIRVIGLVRNLEKLLREEVVDELIFAMPLRRITEADQYINKAEKIGVTVRIVPDWQIHGLMYRPNIASIQFDDFLGVPTMALNSTPANQGALLIKNGVDYLSAGIAMILLAPLFFLISCAIKLSSPGPIFFRQERCGLNGRRFMIYKFRTMVAGAEPMRPELDALNESQGPAFKIKKDPRIIPYVGTFLRRTGFDELPQLMNILKGEMSLVGPRPPIPSEVEAYDIWQRRRLSMKPGLTCLWQVRPDRNDIAFNEWMQMDLHYIDKWSLGLDFRIMLQTIKAVLAGAGR
jgi:exopolysaccharide biosynthesis polyprenyl glycosylphosphotransferase